MKATLPSTSSSLDSYLSDIKRFPLLTAAEEQSLARSCRRKGDTKAAHQLVTANLRFVVKVAYEYRSYGCKMADLIQEGNMGLMKAVQKFDPDQGVRLISYAVWWIRAFIQNYVLRSFSLVKLGTTQAQRKLFYALARTRRELDRLSVEHGADSDGQDSSKIAKRLKVKPGEVDEMTQRMLGRDLSLDAPFRDEGGVTHVDFLADDGPSLEDQACAVEEQGIARQRIAEVLERLDPRERYIVERRIMSDHHMTLKEVGVHFGFSRERARQLEYRAKDKMKQALQALALELDWAARGSDAGELASA